MRPAVAEPFAQRHAYPGSMPDAADLQVRRRARPQRAAVLRPDRSVPAVPGTHTFAVPGAEPEPSAEPDSGSVSIAYPAARA